MSEAAGVTPQVRSEPAESKTLYCSFCFKSQHEVKKLISGPAAIFLCDECVDTLQGKGNQLQWVVDLLRSRGVSWAVIGAALGISRQSAWERFT